ncbi:rhomboid family intramembrane serine protease [Ancylomarina sp. DW003]|nr:rhomboid family intramembrane serine protease [Ancylomarina sp. DW003]MDE5420627.1 rhomboid family intramembrane serine protease [Ancylomarina sp. DW003]
MTTFIIAITALISITAFNKTELLYRYQFNAYQILKREQWYRILTHGFLHANWNHLIVNMIVLYFFGSALENYFNYYLGSSTFYFIALYISSIVFSSLYDLKKYANDYNYNALGASGATSAIVFATIFFDPWQLLYFFFVIPIPGIVFGVLYLAYSYYMNKKQMDNIGHSSHFYGALFGFLFPILVKPELFSIFLQKLF